MRPRGVPAEIFPIGIIGERVGSASMRPRGIPAEISAVPTLAHQRWPGFNEAAGDTRGNLVVQSGIDYISLVLQ